MSPAAAVPHDLVVPPPRPKRKPAKPYPRKADGAAPADESPSGRPPRSSVSAADSLQRSDSPTVQRPSPQTLSPSPLVAPPSGLASAFAAVQPPAHCRGSHGRGCDSRLAKLSSFALDDSCGGAGSSSCLAPQGSLQQHAPPLVANRPQSSLQLLLAYLQLLQGHRLYAQQPPPPPPPPPQQQQQQPLAAQQLQAVAAVAAAASAAAAAAASAVVASADDVTQALLNAHPPSGFPFFGMPPSALVHLATLNPKMQHQTASMLPVPPRTALPCAAQLWPGGRQGAPLGSRFRTGSGSMQAPLHGRRALRARIGDATALAGVDTAAPAAGAGAH